MQKKKPLSLPVWAEAIIVIVLLVMAVVEWDHGQWFFAAIFGITGAGVGAGLISRIAGDKDGKA